jgi:hypothetical protein
MSADCHSNHTAHNATVRAAEHLPYWSSHGTTVSNTLCPTVWSSHIAADAGPIVSAYHCSLHTTLDTAVRAAKFLPYWRSHGTSLWSTVSSALWQTHIAADRGSVTPAHRCSVHATHDTSVRAAEHFPYRTADRTAL